MKPSPPKPKHRLLIQTGGLFTSPHEWCIVDFVYWKSNTQNDRRWTCRMKPIQQYTPVKRIETITDVLDRLCERGMGFSKIPFGKPQRRRSGKGLTAEPKQSNQYVFDAKVFDAWLKAETEKPPIRKRIDPYPKADSQLSENGQKTYPKADTTIREEEVQKKEVKEAVGSQPPSTLAAVAPKQMTGEEMAEAFERCFRSDGHQGSESSPASEGSKDKNQDDGSQPPFPSVAPGVLVQAASGGVQVGLASTGVSFVPESTTIQDANDNAGGQTKPDTFLARVSAPIILPSASGTTNTRATNKSTGHPSKSAHVASVGVGFGFTDAERQELTSKGYTEDNIARMESAYVLEQIYGPRKAKSRHGRDS